MLIIESLLVGLAIGCIVGLLGAGGGILSVPVLVYLLHQNAYNAAAGSLVIVGLTSIVSLLPQLKSHKIQWRDGLLFGVLSVVGSVFGSRLSLLVDETMLMVLFGVLLAAVSIVMFRKAARTRKIEQNEMRQAGKAEDQDDAMAKGSENQTAPENAQEPAKSDSNEPNKSRSTKKQRNIFVVILAATLTGFLTGFFGVGGGFIVVPMLIFALGFNMREASATSLVVMTISSASGLLARIGTSVVLDWAVVIPFAAASMLGGIIGGFTNDRFRASTLTAIFALLLAGVAIFVLAQNLPALL